jgi:hypothetical protein
MGLLVIVQPLLRKCYNYLTPISAGEVNRPDVQGELRLRQRVSYDLIFASIFLFALHGFSAFKVFLILYSNYTLATTLPRKYIPAASWFFNIGILFANELNNGYPYSRIAQSVTFSTFNAGVEPGANWGSILDSYGGLVPRWEILFNITVLRLISFDLDYYWSLEQRGSSPVEVCCMRLLKLVLPLMLCCRSSSI